MSMDLRRDDSESGISSFESSNGSFWGSFAGSGRSSLSNVDASPFGHRHSSTSDGGIIVNPSGVDHSREISCLSRPCTVNLGKRLFRENFFSFFCRPHNEESSLYCVDCSILVCGKCIGSGHRKCQFKSLEAISSLWKTSILREDEAEIKAMKNFILTTQGVFEQKVRAIAKEVDDQVAKIVSQIEEKKLELLYKLNYIKKTKMESWNSQIALCETLLKDLHNLVEDVEGLELKDVMTYRKNLIKRIDGLDYIEDDFIQFLRQPIPRVDLGQIRGSVSPKHSILIKPNLSFCHTFNMCSFIVRDHAKEPVHDVEFMINVSLLDANSKSVYFVIENLQDGVFRVKYYPLNEGTCTLNISLNSVPIAGSPCKLQVVRDDTKVKNSDSSLIMCQTESGEAFCKPWGVCCDYEGRILVVDRGNHCIKTFKESGEFLYKFGREGSGVGEFNRPAGIAVDPNLRRIVIADKDNHRIQVFTYEFRYVFQFGKSGQRDGLFNYPWDVAVNHDGLIAVSDSKNYRIQLFTKDGKFLRKFCFPGKSSKNCREKNMPRGLSFAPDGILLVTEFNGHKIYFFNEKFAVVKVFGREGSDVAEFLRPQGITVNEKGMIAVSDGKNHRIQIFTPDLALTAIIGAVGREPGTFDSPQGISFLPDGRIIVTELGNNRAQILKIPY